MNTSSGLHLALVDGAIGKYMILGPDHFYDTINLDRPSTPLTFGDWNFACGFIALQAGLITILIRLKKAWILVKNRPLQKRFRDFRDKVVGAFIATLGLADRLKLHVNLDVSASPINVATPRSI
jgi:hypothetical protein